MIGIRRGRRRAGVRGRRAGRREHHQRKGRSDLSARHRHYSRLQYRRGAQPDPGATDQDHVQGRQTVKAGDLLAEIDPRPYQAQIEQFTANRARDQAQLTNAEADLSRDTQLGEKGYATPQLIDTQKAQVAQLQAAVQADQAQIDQVNVQLSYTRLTSAISGMTGARQIDVGNVIHPTDPNGLVVVTQIEPISLLFTLPQSDLPAKGSMKVIAYSQDDSMKLDEGELLLVDNEITGTTGAIQLKAEFPNRQHRLWPGQLVNARLLLETRKDAITIPGSAVQQGRPARMSMSSSRIERLNCGSSISLRSAAARHWSIRASKPATSSWSMAISNRSAPVLGRRARPDGWLRHRAASRLICVNGTTGKREIRGAVGAMEQ